MTRSTTDSYDYDEARTFKVVVGYVPGVDALPKEAERLGFRFRVAFVLESYRPDRVDCYFDLDLYVALLASVADVLHADGMTGLDRRGREISARCEQESLKSAIERAGAQDEPLTQVHFVLEDREVGAAFSEPWARAGGPRLYHDSYTVPVFTVVDVSNALVAAARRTSQETGARLAEVYLADEGPTPVGFIERLLSRFRLHPKDPTR